MSDLRLKLEIERPHREAARVFAGPVVCWLPAIVGPDEHSWRADTKEGPVDVRVQVEAGPVFVHADQTSWRRLTVRPDRTSARNFITALFTPSVQGQLGLSPQDDGASSTLTFEGRTARRSAITTALERFLLGDPLARSGLRTLLSQIAERLSRVPLEDLDLDQDRFGIVVCDVNRGA